MRAIISVIVFTVVSVFGMEHSQMPIPSINSFDIKLRRKREDKKDVLQQPSEYWSTIHYNLRLANDVPSKVACLKQLPPEHFWMFYHDYDCSTALQGELLTAFKYVIMSNYCKNNDYRKIDLKLNQAMTTKMLIFDEFSTYYFRLDVEALQERFFKNKAMSTVIEDGLLDLTDQIILDIETDINPDYYPKAFAVKKLLLDKNYLYCPSLAPLREIFPNVETISLKKCPLKIPEDEKRVAWLDDLYAMYGKSDPVRVNFPCYGEVIIGYFQGYCPLTICLSPDVDQTVAKAFEYVAATQWYNMRRIVLKTSKMFFYTISLISLILGWAVIYQEAKKKPYKVDFDKEKDERHLMRGLRWHIARIVDEYRSDWVYKKRPQIIFEQ